MNVLFVGIAVALFALALLQSYYRRMKINGVKIRWPRNHSKTPNMATKDKGWRLVQCMRSSPMKNSRLTEKPVLKAAGR